MRLVIGFPESKDLARKLAKKSRSSYSDIEIDKFPDKETRLRYLKDVKSKIVYLVQSLDDPDSKLIEVILAAYTAKELGAKKVILIAPYLCYMRQDKRFRPGEAVSSRVIARLFNNCLDGLITVDPHLHRYKSLDKIFKMKTKRLSAVNHIAGYIKKNIKNPFVFGPDAESFQWARKVAKIVGCKADVLNKHRYSSDTVRIKIKHDFDFTKKSVVIVDDVVSTGHTVMEVVKGAKSLGAKRIYTVCTHGIYAENSLSKIRRLRAIPISTNTINNPTSKIDLSDMIAKEIR